MHQLNWLKVPFYCTIQRILGCNMRVMEGLNISLYWICTSPRSFTDAITSEQPSECKMWCIGFILHIFLVSALKTQTCTSEVNLIHYYTGSPSLSWTRLSLKDFQVSTIVHRSCGVGLWQVISRLPCVKGFFDVGFRNQDGCRRLMKM